MEKLPEFDHNVPLSRALPLPFKTVTLMRPMQQFSRSMGLTPGQPGIPSADFVLVILGDHHTFRSAVRSLFGDDYKNIENRAKGLRTSERIEKRLFDKVAGDTLLMGLLTGTLKGQGQAGSPASLQNMALMLEGALVRVADYLLHVVPTCPACATELSDTDASWWRAQSVEIGPTEAEFVDRLLYAILASSVGSHYSLLGSASPRRLQELVGANLQPFASWLELLRRRTRSPTLKDLEARSGGGVPAQTIHRINEGDILTHDLAQRLTRELARSDPKEAREFRALASYARALALAGNFLRAAHQSRHPLREVDSFAALSKRMGMLIHRLGWLELGFANRG